MISEINHDIILLQKTSEPATEKDLWVMLNPEIIKTSKETYLAQEQCLSISGIRQTRRYRRIKVRYQDEHMNIKIKTFHDRTAQIIQHEIDHCNGILI